MAWNQLRPSTTQILNRIPRWEERGLGYWQQRVERCRERIATADSSGQLGRAIQDRDVALEAVRQLSQRDEEEEYDAMEELRRAALDHRGQP